MYWMYDVEYDTVQCVVCSKKIRVRDADDLNEVPICSADCSDRWERWEQAMENRE